MASGNVGSVGVGSVCVGVGISGASVVTPGSLTGGENGVSVVVVVVVVISTGAVVIGAAGWLVVYRSVGSFVAIGSAGAIIGELGSGVTGDRGVSLGVISSGILGLLGFVP